MLLKSCRWGVLGLSAWIVGLAPAQLTDPVPDIPLGSIEVEIIDWVQLPNSQALVDGKPDHRPGSVARINFLREAPDGRLFINDLRGQIYRLDDQLQPQLYVDVDAAPTPLFPAIGFHGGLAGGLISFEFHPEFATNGIFYTIHMEDGDDATSTPDFTPEEAGNPGADILYHTVLTEWTAAVPGADSWSGTHRELLRVGLTAPNFFHPFGDPRFNPTADPNDSDYGLLYISGGDWAYIADSPQQPEQLQRLDTLVGTCIRIDPRSPGVTGGPAGLGDYTVPLGNPFFEDVNADQLDDDPNTFAEIWTYGHRNAHRQVWDAAGNQYVLEIGQRQIEEINRLLPGCNYGWPLREGTFVNGLDTAAGGNGNSEQVFALTLPPAADVDARGQPYMYPVVQYDHGDGRAIAGGFPYAGAGVPQLQGQFVFGDIVTGRIYVASQAAVLAADDGDPGTTAAPEELQLIHDGQPTTLLDLVRATLGNSTNRADLRFGRDAAGELYVLTKEDGMLRRLIFRPVFQWHCLQGPDVSAGAACGPGDCDGDQDVDLHDVLALQLAGHP